MADDNLDALNDDRLLSRAESIKDSFVDLRNATREANQQLMRMGEAMTSYASTYSAVTRSANKVADIQKQAAKSSSAVNDAIKEQEKNLNIIRQLNTKIDDLYQRASRATGDTRLALLGQAQNLSSARDNAKELADTFGQLASDSAKLNSKTAFFNGISNIVSDIPGLRKLSGPFQDAAKAARETVLSNAKGGKQISVMGAGMKGFAKSAMSSATSFLKSGGYIGLIVKGLIELVKLGLAADKEVTEIGKSLGISYQQALKVRNEFRSMSTDAEELYINNEKRIKTLLSLNRSFGTASSSLSKDLIDNQIRLTDGIGLSVNNAEELNKQLVLSGKSAEVFNLELSSAAVAVQAAENISIDTRAVFEDIATASKAVKINYLGANKELAKAATLARRYGLSLGMLDTTAGSLLSFESSISSELEAELLLGKQINLERARSAALANDYTTLAAEIGREVGSAAEFSKMNRIQQEAIAKSVGMNREQLADVLYQQELLNKIGAKEEDSMKKRLQLAMEKYSTEAEAAEALGAAVFNNLKQQSIQEDFNSLLQNAKQLLVEILGGPMAEILKNFMGNKEAVNDLINGFRSFGQSVLQVGTFLDAVIVKPISAVTNALKGAIKLISAAGRFLSGDFAGGIQKGAEGFTDITTAAGNALDIGTNAIVGLTGMGQKNYFTDIGAGKKDFAGNTLTPLATGGIVRKPTKALVGEAGSEAVIPLREFYAKMDEMIQATREGKVINLDGRKVNQGLAMASSKLDRYQ